MNRYSVSIQAFALVPLLTLLIPVPLRAQMVDDRATGPPVPVAAASETGAMSSVSPRSFLRSVRSALSRALAIQEPTHRARKLRRIADIVTQRLGEDADDGPWRWDLFGNLIDIQEELGDLESAQNTIQRLQQEVADALGTARFQRWLDDEVTRRWNSRDFDIAIWQLQMSLRLRPDNDVAARRSLLIGDILVQKVFPDGPYDEAIVWYAGVAQKYGQTFPEIAEDARLRQARTLWRSGKRADAEAITAMLQESSNDTMAEDARHLARVMQTSSTVDPRQIP